MVRLLALLVLLGACSSAPRSEPPRREPVVAPPPAGEPPLETVELLTAGAVASERLPVVVAIHGMGGTPGDMVLAFRELRIKARVVALQGIDPIAPQGFSWFRIEEGDRDAPWFVEGVRIAERRVASSLEHIAAEPLTCGKPLIVGFSQGGILSFSIATERPELVRAAVPLAGMLPLGMTPHVGARTKIAAFHGEVDDVITIAEARRSEALLRDAGYDVTLRTYPGVPHLVPEPMRHDALEAIATLLDGACD